MGLTNYCPATRTARLRVSKAVLVLCFLRMCQDINRAHAQNVGLATLVEFCASADGAVHASFAAELMLLYTLGVVHNV